MEKEIYPMILEYITEEDNETIRLPLVGDSLKAKIDWGDGSPVEIVTSEYPTHKYIKKGVYEVKIIGTVPRMNGSDLFFSERRRLTGIKSWGKLDRLTSMTDAFWECKKLRGKLPNDDYGCFENVTDFSGCFRGCSGLTGNIPENLFANCPNVTNFSSCFGYCRGLTGTTPVNILEDGTRIELWERAGKEGYPAEIYGGGCFYGCTGLSNYPEIPSGWK